MGWLPGCLIIWPNAAPGNSAMAPKQIADEARRLASRLWTVMGFPGACRCCWRLCSRERDTPRSVAKTLTVELREQLSDHVGSTSYDGGFSLHNPVPHQRLARVVERKPWPFCESAADSRDDAAGQAF